MIERLLENWLDKANERSFQIPFCHSLTNQGFTVLHLTRHCGMEMGKDIIAVSSDGTPHVYQLKSVHGGKLTLSQWDKDLFPQVVKMVYLKTIHPSITSSKPHKSYIVINGDFDEETSHAIDEFNRARRDDGEQHKQVNTIVKGQLLESFLALQDNFWLPNLGDIKTYLELYLETGKGNLPKDKLSKLFTSSMPYNVINGKQPSINKCERALAGNAIICSSAISSYTNSDNYVAEFEAWTLYLSYTLALAERWNLPEDSWTFELDIAQKSIYNALSNLCDELIARKHYVEGDPLSDKRIYRIRMTYLLGLMSIYAIWRKTLQTNLDNEHDLFIREFCLNNINKVELWGEFAVPQLIVLYVYLRTIDATLKPDFQILASLIDTISKHNRPRCNEGLANPYYDVEDILPYITTFIDKPLSGELLRDSFNGCSYTLESLIHLFVRTNWKQRMKALWPSTTQIAKLSFIPNNPWEFYFWRNREGINQIEFTVPTQCWDDLKHKAFESEGKEIPTLIKQYPIQFLCLLIVMPHRINSSGIRWVTTKLEKMGVI